jgi:hypothetical protein
MHPVQHRVANHLMDHLQHDGDERFGTASGYLDLRADRLRVIAEQPYRRLDQPTEPILERREFGGHAEQRVEIWAERMIRRRTSSASAAPAAVLRNAACSHCTIIRCRALFMWCRGNRNASNDLSAEAASTRWWLPTSLYAEAAQASENAFMSLRLIVRRCGTSRAKADHAARALVVSADTHEAWPRDGLWADFGRGDASILRAGRAARATHAGTTRGQSP